MASNRWSKERVLDSEYAYQIFNIISQNKDGSYASAINREIEKYDREEVSRVISKMKDIGLLRKGKRSKAQYYEIDSTGTARLFSELWEYEDEINEDFECFLNNYVSSHDVINSTIRNMLTRDFAQSINTYRHVKGDLPDQINSFLDQIKDLEKYPSLLEYIESALNETFSEN